MRKIRNCITELTEKIRESQRLKQVDKERIIQKVEFIYEEIKIYSKPVKK